MQIFTPLTMWAGTEAAYETFIKENEYAASLTPPTTAYAGQQEEAPPPRLLEVQGQVGVVSIKGSLVNNDSWINAFVGRTGYPEIRAAMVAASMDPNVKAIVLDINSGGGMVNGLSDAAELIAKIDKEVKPVHAFSDGAIASAAYWLGSSARSLDIGKVTEAGSIGTLMVHQEVSKALTAEGVTTTLIRSGPYKALGHSAERLSALGQETLQASVDTMNTMFEEHVASARGVSMSHVHDTMGQGRTFIGQQAVDVGLVDSITNFDTLMSKVNRGIDLQKSGPQYPAHLTQKGLPVKTALTEQQIALMAAGVVATQASASAEAASESAARATVSAETAAASAEQATEATTEANAAASAAPDPVVTLLQSQLAAAQAQVVALSVEATTLKAAAEAGTKQADLMRPIVRAAVGNLRVALGGASAGVDAMTDDLLIAEHASLAAQFNSKFKVGGVAAVSSAEQTTKNDGGSADHMRMARIRATRTTAK